MAYILKPKQLGPVFVQPMYELVFKALPRGSLIVTCIITLVSTGRQRNFQKPMVEVAKNHSSIVINHHHTTALEKHDWGICI